MKQSTRFIIRVNPSYCGQVVVTGSAWPKAAACYVKPFIRYLHIELFKTNAIFAFDLWHVHATSTRSTTAATGYEKTTQLTYLTNSKASKIARCVAFSRLKTISRIYLKEIKISDNTQKTMNFEFIKSNMSDDRTRQIITSNTDSELSISTLTYL